MYLLLVLAFSSLSLRSQESPVNPPDSASGLYITHSGDSILLGEIHRREFQKPPFNQWFMAEYREYSVDEALLDSIRQAIRDVRVQVFLGSWCEDSQREVPRLLKILDALDFRESGLQLISLNNEEEHYKESPGGEEKGLDIYAVPTVIFYREGVELGRIIEFPESSLEEDMLSIIRH